MFRDRVEAGVRLAARFQDIKRAPDTVVIGIPRGGVVVAAAFARVLELPVDVFVAVKIRAPDQPELAVGAVTETGGLYLNRALLRVVGLTPQALDAEVAGRRREAAKRARVFRGGRALTPVAGKTVVLVDDGAATGSTMLAAIDSLRAFGPAALVAALPVGSAGTLSMIRARVERLEAIEEPMLFDSVGESYEDFEPVHPTQVLEALKPARLVKT